MRFMMIVKATKDTEAGVMPGDKMISEMTKYNEQLLKAGVLIDGTGLHPSSKGARVFCSGDKRTVVDGPFAETKELIAGYWLINVKSKQEAIDWATKAPNPYGEKGEGHIEIRQLFSAEDFGTSEAVEDAKKLESKFRGK
jgi:hypothetical protein